MMMSSKPSTTIKLIAGRICPAMGIMATTAMLLLASCNGKKQESSEVAIVVAEGMTLYANEVEKLIPSNLPPSDSAKLVNEYAKKWAEEILFYEKAKSNIPNKAEVERLVEDYKKNLIINLYQNQLIEENFNSIIPEATIKAYYESNSKAFRLDQSVVKGVFIKLRNGSQQARLARQIIGNEKKRDELERLSLKDAANYLYSRDQWIGIDVISERSPFATTLARLKETKVLLEESDSSYIYMFYVDSLLREGSTMPYEMAKDEIRETLLNEQKVEFIQSVKNDIYTSALKQGRVKHMNDNANHN